MPDRPKAVTIRDVAELAGVSVGTASKALNGRGRLRRETREQVLAAADQLGFRPNTLARGLLEGRTYTVGLVTDDSFGRFSLPVLLGAESALDAGRISAFMCDTRADPARERHYVEQLVDRRVDGIIVSGRRTEARQPLAGAELRDGIPVVYAMTRTNDPDDIAVIPDDEQGGALAARHLYQDGRRRIGHITGPERFQVSHDRARGLGSVLRGNGLTLAGSVLRGEWSEEWGREGARILLESAPDVDAVVCGSDQIARGVVDTLLARGVRVPQDVAVTGFDNWEPMALGCPTALTTVDMNLEEIGRKAADELLALIDGTEKPEPGVRKMPCRLVIRRSTGR